MSTNRENSPSFALFSAINGLSITLGNASTIESEAERRDEARKFHIDSMNAIGQLVSDRATRMLREGADFVDCMTELSAGSPTGSRDPEPPSDDMLEGFEEIAKSLFECSERGEQALRNGGALDLDNATQPNEEGQPRSIELALLFNKSESHGHAMKSAMMLRSMNLQELPGAMRETGNRIAVIRDELLAVMETPAKFRSKGTSQLAAMLEVLTTRIADGESLANEGNAAKPKLPMIREADRQIYQLYAGGLNQGEIAAAMTEHTGKTWRQPRISEALKRMAMHQDASGLSELLPKPAEREHALDPRKLEMGQRTDGRSKTLRAKSRQNAQER